MKTNKFLLKLTIFSCLIFLIFFSQSHQYETSISKNIDFDLFSLGRNNYEENMTFSMCFSGVSQKTKTLIFKDQKVALNTIVSNSIRLSNGMYSEGAAISSVVWDNIKMHYVMTDNIFKTFTSQSVYCLVFNSNSSVNSLKNLSLQATESNANGAIVYHSIKNFSSIELYNVKESALSMSNFSFSTTTIYPTTEFNLKVQFNVRLHPNRIIPSSEDLVTLILDFENILVNTVAISNQSVSILPNPAEAEPLKASLSKVPNFEEKGSTIVLYNFGENFKNGRQFFMTFSRLRPAGYSNSSFKIKARLLWKNTNSVISEDNVNLNLSTSLYSINSAKMRHINDFTTLYTSASWPMEVSFRVNISVFNRTVIISDSNSAVQFLSTTCDFSLNRVTNSKCKSMTSSSITITDVTINENEVFYVKVWIFTSSVNPNLRITVSDLTNESAVALDFNILSSFYNSNSSFEDVVNPCTGRANQGECNTRLIVNENSGNFVLLNPTSDNTISLDSSTETINLQSSKTKTFRLRSRFLLTHNGNTNNMSQTFAGDWIRQNSGVTYNDDNFMFGTHELIFPKDFMNRSSINRNGLSQCRLSWGTSKTPDANGTDNESLYKSVTNFTLNKLNNFQDFTNPVTNANNKISFRNFNENSLTVGFFGNVIRSFACSNYGEQNESCNINQNTNLERNNNIDYELATDCFVYKNDYSMNSIYSAYDFMHTFTLNGKGVVRMNRYVSILPQPGIFQTIADFSNSKFTFDGNQQKILNSHHFVNYSSEAICIIIVDLNNNTLVPGRGTSRLHGFFNNFELIEFEDMDNYPVGNLFASVSLSKFISNKSYQNSFRNLSNSKSVNESDVEYYNNSDYSSYISNVFRFNISTIQYNSEFIIPVKCKVDTRPEIDSSNNSNFVRLVFNEIGTSLNGIVNTYSYRDITDSRLNFFYKRNIDLTQISTVNDLKGKFNGFVYDINTQLTFTQSSTFNNVNDMAENQIKYLVLTSKVNFNLQNRILDNGFTVVESSNYSNLSVTNKFNLNNVQFSSLMLKYLANGSTFRSRSLSPNNYRISFEGVPLNIHNDDLVKSNDLGLALMGTSFIVTNYNGSYNIDNSNKISKTNDVDIIKQISYITKDIKNGDGSRTVCGQVLINVNQFSNFFDVYSNNFNQFTIAEIEGQSRTYTTSGNSFRFEVKGQTQDYRIYFCNLNVSSSSRFEITRVLYFFKNNTTEYQDHQFTNKFVTTSISDTINYTYGRVISIVFDNPKITTSMMTLLVSLDHEVFRNMHLTISGDITSSNLIENYTPKCLPLFNDNIDDPLNVLFESCEVDNVNKIIRITTHNQILVYTNLPKIFTVRIYHVKVANLNDIKFTVSSRFNAENSSSLFPSEALNVSTKQTFLSENENYTNTPFNISSLMTFNSIVPNHPELPSLMSVLINTKNTTNESYTKFTEKWKPNPNEIRIVLNPSYFGPVPNNFKCYVNDVQITNCITENEVIYIRTVLNLTEDIKVSIYGYPVPEKSAINVNSAFWAISLAYRTTFDRLTWFNGLVNLVSNFNADNFVLPSSKGNLSLLSNTTTNLRIFNQIFTNPNPTSSGTDLTLNFDIDYLNGLYSSSPVFTIENVKNSIFYLVLPNNITLMNDSVLKLSADYFIPQTTDAKETVKTTEFELKNVGIIGQLIMASFDTDFKIDSTFRGFNLNLSKLSTPNNETQVDKFDITITDASGSFYLKTYPLLSTQFTQYPLETRIGNIRNFRGFNFVYSPSKYSFIVNYNSSFTPGVYVKIGLTVVGKGLKNAETSVSLSSASNFIYPSNNVVVMDGRLRNKNDLYVGLSCGEIIGKYIVNIESSNKENFHNVSSAIFNIRKIVKNKVTLFKTFTEEYNLNTDVLSFGKGGYINFWVKPLDLNAENIVVSFTTRENTKTTNAPPSSVAIPPKSNNPVLAVYTSSDVNVNTKQTYDMTVTENNCFESKIQYVIFHPNINIERFDNLNISLSEFVYQNSDNNASIKSNSIRFIVNSNKAQVLPAPTNFYCSLSCVNRPEISSVSLRSLPHPQNNWYESYFYRQILSSETFNMDFDDLVRDETYTLKCLIENSNLNVTERSSLSRTFNSMQGRVIEPSKTPVIKCVDLYVKNQDNSFESHSLDILQDNFFENYESKGCVHVLDSQRRNSLGFDGVDQECLNTISTDLPDIEESNNSNGQSIVSPVNRTSSDSAPSSRHLQGNKINRRLLRFLQNSTNSTNSTDSNSTNSTNNNNTDNTPNPPVIISQSVYRHRICMVQSRTCPTQFGASQTLDLNENLFDLFKGEIYNQTSSAVNSPFRAKLNENQNSNFLGYRLKEIGNFTLDDKDVKVLYNSDFQIYNTTLNSKLMNTTTMNFTFSSSQENELRCWYAVNTNIASDSQVSRRSITVCNSSNNVICGPSEGIVLPHQINYTLPLSAIPEKEYALWMTCRENAHASRSFKDPYLAMRLTNYYPQNLLSPRIFDTECKDGHFYFPHCCSSGKADKENKLVCSSKYVNVYILFALFLYAFLFN